MPSLFCLWVVWSDYFSVQVVLLNYCCDTKERFNFCIGFRWKVYIENGSSLCVGCELCWSIKLQVFPTFFGMLTVWSSVCTLVSIQMLFHACNNLLSFGLFLLQSLCHDFVLYQVVFCTSIQSLFVYIITDNLFSLPRFDRVILDLFLIPLYKISLVFRTLNISLSMFGLKCFYYIVSW